MKEGANQSGSAIRAEIGRCDADSGPVRAIFGQIGAQRDQGSAISGSLAV
ncbi:MAG: hypothetical protein AB7E24_17215 [Novosphingobium sp.]